MLMRHLSSNNQVNKIYADDIFSTYTYTGNGSNQTITNGIDLAGEGGMCWVKQRNGTQPNILFDTVRGAGKYLSTNNNDPMGDYGAGVGLFNSDGFRVQDDPSGSYFTNGSGFTYASWTFRKSPKFFSLSTLTKSSGSDATVSFTDLETLGMVIVKRTDSIGSWYVWHRSLTAGKLLYLEQTAAEATLGHITVSGTTVTLENGVIADGTYIVYAFAHDTSEDGLIQCGSFTTVSGGNATVNLGWEPQYVLWKPITTTAGWYLLDTYRGFDNSDTDKLLQPNTSSSEEGIQMGSPFSTGFTTSGISSSATFVYIAIRRSNKPPTSGSQVYNAIARTGTGATTQTDTSIGFVPDLALIKGRSVGTAGFMYDRLRGKDKYLGANITDTEVDGGLSFSSTNGTIVIGGSAGWHTETGRTHIDCFFKRATGFFDIVCYTGTGVARTVNHNLGAVPELMIVKSRSSSGTSWMVYSKDINIAQFLYLNQTNASTNASQWNDTNPTAYVFSVSAGGAVNTTSATYVAYLFASLDGISKIGSYTGNGSTQNIDMGFNSGCRFFLVKASSTPGSWWVYDSVRGITAAADTALQLNSATAEITTADAIDNYAAGITVNQETTCNINVTSATYIYLAIS